jgi:hypothetical protein
MSKHINNTCINTEHKGLCRLTKKAISNKDKIDNILNKKISKSMRSKYNYNTNSKSFIEEIKKSLIIEKFEENNKVYKPYVILDDQFNNIDKIYGLKTMLYKHQQTAVAAMLDIENQRIIEYSAHAQSSANEQNEQNEQNEPNEPNLNIRQFELQYNAAVLSEPVGSGKTIDILSIIIINKIPRAMPDIAVSGDMIIRTKFNKLIKSTLIFVSSSVLNQWEQSIKKFTYLTYYVIKSVIELRVLFKMIASKGVNKYDIILIKNGIISVPMDFPEDIEIYDKNKIKPISIYNVISNLYTHCWARVVFDDFDNIKIPVNASKINALFTWYVSSTRDDNKIGIRECIAHQTEISKILIEFNNSYYNIINDEIGFKLLNIRNSQQFINNHNMMPFIKFHVVAFISVNDNVINMIGVMGNGDLTEMLNGDAVGEAAARIGINATSVIDIFEKILGDNYTNYIMASKIMAFIEYQEEKSDERLPMGENPDETDTYYGIERLNNFEDIKYKYPNISGILREAYLKYENIKNKAGLSIQRVKDNIKHGECPICIRSLATVDDYIIVKCCNNILCRQCGISSQLVGGKISRCSNCRAQLTVKDLIFVGESLDLDKIVNEEFDDSEPADDSSASSTESETEIDNKFDAVIAIIKKKKIKNDVRVELNLPNVIKGSCYLKEAQNRKVLIFANYKESLTKMSEKLEKNGIKFWTLGGTAKEIFELSNNFTECETECALLIKATEYCSGLNLQTATDLIFLHRMENVELECQVIGRGQRMGRNSPLNIWYMLFENELDKLVNSHGVRKLTPEDLEDENNEKIRNNMINNEVNEVNRANEKIRNNMISNKTNAKEEAVVAMSSINNRVEEDDDEEVVIEEYEDVESNYSE